MKKPIAKSLMIFYCSIFTIHSLYAETNAPANPNSVQISSDHIKQDKNRIIYDGNVIVMQGALIIHADKAVIKNNIKQNKVITTGHPATFGSCGIPMAFG